MFVVDGTQSVGAVPFDVRVLKPDFLLVAGYKWMLCPYGVSFLYVDPRYHQQGIPLEQHGWDEHGSERSAATFGVPGYESSDGILKDEHSASARRFDVGERANFATLPSAIASVEQLLDWGVDEVGATIAPLTEAVARAAKERGLITPAQHAPHLIPLRTYSAESQKPNPTDNSPPLDEHGIKRIQQIVGGILYYARAVDITVLAALSTLAAEQTTATKKTNNKITQLLDYLATHPNATI
jgi:selenocysteine lyase/cysteine desulfurase